LVSLAVAPSLAAVSAGGTTSSVATLIGLGETQYVQAPECSYIGFSYCDSEWWDINLTSGDHVTIYGTDPSNATWMTVYAAGGSTPINSSENFYQGDGVEFYAATTGTYYLNVQDDGIQIGEATTDPYTFTVSASHSADVYLQNPIHLSRGIKETIHALVRYPDQTPVSSSSSGPVVSLELLYSSPSFAPPSWHVFATSYVNEGTATFSFVTPRGLPGSSVKVVAELSGADFLRSSSSQVIETSRGVR